MNCPCGHEVILADTEDWQVPRCYSCATDKDENVATYFWRCNKCLKKPHKCLCDKPEWITYKNDETVLGDYTFMSSADFKE